VQTTTDKRANTTSTEARSPLAPYEAGFDPAEYDEPVAEVLRSHADRRKLYEAESERDSVLVQIEYLQGFRIQLFASSSIDEANAMKATASQIFSEDSVYVVFDPPVYKVRVGDFLTRVEASRKLPSFVEKGFPDAWVVNDRIIRRKLVRTRPEVR
jgi:hypothetical protein